jgi:glucose-1-phosphate thymidylyltransferase
MEAVGLIPAAGYGSRLRPFRYPKELLPLGYAPPSHPESEGPRIKVVCEYALDNLVEAGIGQAYVVVSDHKCEILRFLSDGRDYRIRLAYLHQSEVVGLPSAIDCAYGWIGERTTALVLPDAIVEPRDAVRQLLDLRRRRGAEVVLGVFPTERPEELCPVRVDDHQRVVALYDKDKDAAGGLRNTWGMAVWGPGFGEFLHAHLAQSERSAARAGRELTLADVLTAAIASGLEVVALQVAGGKFWDIGKSTSLIQARLELEAGKHGLAEVPASL